MARQIRPGQLQENVLYNISASFAVSASHEITHEVSSSYAETASFAVTASHLLNNPPAFPFTGDAVITGSLVVSGSGINITSGSITGDGSGLTNIGSPSLNDISLGNSTVVGDGASSAASYGTVFGKSATSTGGQNVGIGSFSNVKTFGVSIGHSVVGGNNTVAIGYNAGHTSGENNVLVGYQPGTNTSGDYNISLGYLAGYDQTTGTGNITIGSGSRGIAGESNQLRIGHGIHGATISASLETGDVIFASTASAEYLSTPAGNLSPISASYAVTASHALNAVASATNFTQSLFVTPNGNDGTAAVGDMLNPFHTILAATASSNIGDTIIIYPGTYPSESANIIKDGVNYYFYPGAIVHPTASLSEYIVDIQDPTYPVNVRGAGSFISDDTSYGAIRIQAEECYFEFDIAKTTNNTTNTYNQGGTVDLEPTNASSGRISTNDIKGNPFYINGKIINTGNFGTYGGALILGRNGLTDYSSLIFEGSIMQLHPTDTRPAIYVASNKTTYDFSVNANVFASASQAVYSDGRGAVRLRGIYSTGDRGNKYAIELTDGYQTHYDIDAHINGSVKLNTGDINNSGGILRGTILTGNTTPDDAAIYINGGGQHKIDNQIFMRDSGGYGIKIETDDAQVEFTGDFNADAGSSYINFCKVTTGKLIFKGSLGSKANRGNGNIINGGHLVIDSFFDNDGFNYPDNAYCFQLSAGTLEINNKVTHAYTTPGSGIVDMTGGYLKLNGAELVQLNGTGSFAYGVDLNGGSHSGSILNNSFTNLTPFGPGAFTNEITGGGTLFYSDKLY